jgi:type II secretory pathway pseudopilin PulG
MKTTRSRFFYLPEARSYKLEAGYSLVETLIYIALLAIILVGLLQSMNLMLRSWRESQSRTILAQSGALAMARLAHDIRAASGIDSGGSSFGTTTGSIKVTMSDAGVSTSTTFYATSSMLYVAQGTGTAAALLPSNIGVQGFTVYQITTANSQAVRIVLILQTATTSVPVSATFYDTFVLRGSY